MKNTADDIHDYQKHRHYFNKCADAIVAYKDKKITSIKDLEIKFNSIAQEHIPLRVTASRGKVRKDLNPLMEHLLGGYLSQLNSHIESQIDSNTDIKGSVRESFVDLILKDMIPVIYRTGQGEIIDMAGHRSGQMDIVIEYPFMPSLPYQPGLLPRLYLAEGVALTIEVKSNLSTQFEQVLEKGEKVTRLEPKVGDVFTFANPRFQESHYHNPNPVDPHNHLGYGRYYIPLYIITFTGWEGLERYRHIIMNHRYIEGIFDISKQIYCSRYYSYELINGPWALWAFLSEIYLDLRVASYAAFPHQYYMDFNPDA